MQAAVDALDRLYLERERGQTVCPTCNRPLTASAGHLVAIAFADYLLARENSVSIGSIRPRLAHVLDFLDATARTTTLTCEQAGSELIEEFRRWSAKQPVVAGKFTRDRTPGATESCVGSWAAAINYAHGRRDTPFPAAFKVLAPSMVSRTPTHRSDAAELASMFRYCLRPQPPAGEEWSLKMRARQALYRVNLLNFLRASVATWARPDAVHDISTDPKRDQWISTSRVLRLNPRGRRQTKKYRPEIPVPAKFAAILDATDGFLIPVSSVRKACEAMLDELGLPRDRETGLKLIRRSVAQIIRRRIGEERWVQGEIMLGHRKASTSDLYALFDVANLGVALAATEALIDEIESLCPGAFTGVAPGLQLVAGGKK